MPEWVLSILKGNSYTGFNGSKWGQFKLIFYDIGWSLYERGYNGSVILLYLTMVSGCSF